MLVGISGYEDSDWEYQPDATHHNQYKGSTTPGQTSDRSTISYLCAQCHGQFHSPIDNLNEGGSSSPWLRHPTEYAMKNSGEYANYGGGSHTYLPATPLGSTDISSPVATITYSNDSIVTCVSCHRAHGSEYYKAMRWGYAESNTGGLCVNCHTSKD
jgi:predicted CXXCH cytochrome family protein